MLINVLSHHQHHFDVWYYRKMRMIHKKIYAKILFCISYLCIWYDKFLWAIWRGIRKMCTSVRTRVWKQNQPFQPHPHPHLPSPSLALTFTCPHLHLPSPSPSLHIRTLILTSHPHAHARAQLSGSHLKKIKN
jgi:hypothetical protein